MLNLPPSQVNVVNSLSRRGLLVRWKPPVTRKYPYRRGRPSRRGRGHLRTTRFGLASGVTPTVGVTLVCSKNNFWGLIHEGGRLTRTISAGTLPGFEGSKRGRVQAAGGVAVALRKLLAWATRPRRVRARRLRPQFTRHRRGRRPRRWRRWRYRGRRGRIHPWGLTLVGWTRDKRWRYALRQLAPRGRVLVGVHPLRSHNGLRGCSPRRK